MQLFRSYGAISLCAWNKQTFYSVVHVAWQSLLGSFYFTFLAVTKATVQNRAVILNQITLVDRWIHFGWMSPIIKYSLCQTKSAIQLTYILLTSRIIFTVMQTDTFSIDDWLPNSSASHTHLYWVTSSVQCQYCASLEAHIAGELSTLVYFSVRRWAMKWKTMEWKSLIWNEIIEPIVFYRDGRGRESNVNNSG